MIQGYNKKDYVYAFFDGSCEPKNPGGNMGMGSVVKFNEKIIFENSYFEEESHLNSNNVAEYLALYECLKYIIENKLNHHKVRVHGDSMLVVKQMNKQWRIKEGLYVYAAKLCFNLLPEFKDIKFNWIPRERNEYCDNLSKLKTLVYEDDENIEANRFERF